MILAANNPIRTKTLIIPSSRPPAKNPYPRGELRLTKKSNPPIVSATARDHTIAKSIQIGTAISKRSSNGIGRRLTRKEIGTKMFNTSVAVGNMMRIRIKLNDERRRNSRNQNNIRITSPACGPVFYFAAHLSTVPVRIRKNWMRPVPFVLTSTAADRVTGTESPRKCARSKCFRMPQGRQSCALLSGYDHRPAR
jgi:hypothetical protein